MRRLVCYCQWLAPVVAELASSAVSGLEELVDRSVCTGCPCRESVVHCRSSARNCSTVEIGFRAGWPLHYRHDCLLVCLMTPVNSFGGNRFDFI